VSREQQDLLSQVEETQERLQASIEESKRLTERSQELLDRHRQEPGANNPR
jgi:hypothetical protein